MKRYEFKNATADYTGGGCYTFFGKVFDKKMNYTEYFVANAEGDDLFDVAFSDEDCSVEGKWGYPVGHDSEWLDENAWMPCDEKAVKEFMVELLDYILCNPVEGGNYAECDLEEFLENLSDVAGYVLDEDYDQDAEEEDDEVVFESGVSDAERGLADRINEWLGCEAVTLDEENCYIEVETYANCEQLRYIVECDNAEDMYNTLQSMLDGILLYSFIKVDRKGE